MTTPSPRQRAGQRRDCRCPRARHNHGTSQAYIADRCRCLPCSRANARRQKRNRVRIERIGARTPATFAPPIGVARRLQALAACGWSADDLAPLLATSAPNVIRWRTGRAHQSVRADTLARVSAVYDQVWNQPPPGRYSAKVRNLAARHGWRPPMALDDDSIDVPDLLPHGSHAAFNRHAWRGESPCPDCIGGERAYQAARHSRRKSAAA